MNDSFNTRMEKLKQKQKVSKMEDLLTSLHIFIVDFQMALERDKTIFNKEVIMRYFKYYDYSDYSIYVILRFLQDVANHV